MSAPKPDFNPASKPTRTFYYGFLLGGVIVLLIMLFFFRSEVSDMKITSDGNGAFSLDLKKKEMSSQELLDTLRAHDFSRNGLIGFIKKKDYVNKNEQEFKDAMLRNLENIDTEDPIVTLLKKMAIEKRGPWKIEADSAYFSAPNYVIDKGVACTYNGSQLIGLNIIVQNSDATTRKVLKVKGGVVKGSGPDFPSNLIQLNKQEFHEIFGNEVTKTWGWLQPEE